MSVHALVIHSGSNNNTAPGGALAGSGWQYQGQWGNALGTTIGPNHFVSATHLGKSVGDTFTFNGTPYTTIAVSHDPGSDLSIWEVGGAFPTWADLYPHSDETGKDLVVFGRGNPRGAPVNVGTEAKGWRWGTSDQVQRWGTNEVSTVGVVSGVPVIYAHFDDLPGTEEAHLANLDSGGGVFLQDALDGNTWKLAGINYASVCCYFNTVDNGTGFAASLFDAGGMYFSSTNNDPWTHQTDMVADLPTFWVATRVSERVAWIESIVPEPNSGALLVFALGLLCLKGRCRSRT